MKISPASLEENTSKTKIHKLTFSEKIGNFKVDLLVEYPELWQCTFNILD